MLKYIIHKLFANVNSFFLRKFNKMLYKNSKKVGITSSITLSNIIKNCLNVAIMDINEIWRIFNANPEGLNIQEVKKANQRFGYNVILKQKPLSWWIHLWICYRNPFNLLLTALGSISYITHDLFATSIIALMLITSTLLNFIQEISSSKATDSLKAMITNTATVARIVNEKGKSNWVNLPINQIVPGDMIKLSAGDIIPADLRIIQDCDFFVTQSSLTGEPQPIKKVAHANYKNHINPLECETLCFMGTTVVSGSAQAVVIATGENTWFGQLAKHTNKYERKKNAFQEGISQISILLIRFMIIMTPIVLLINGYTKGNWGEAAIFALSIAVGLTPEMLPMIVTCTLARGAIRLSKQKIIVKHLDAIQNFGAMDILCTDKTGTLTKNKITLKDYTDVTGQTSEYVLRISWLNSFFQTGLKNLIDSAILDGIDKKTSTKFSHNWDKIDEIPFNFERRRMSVIVSKNFGIHQIICKGALQEILNICNKVRYNGRVVPLDNIMLQEIKYITNNLNSQGLRILAVAHKYIAVQKKIYESIDEFNLTLEGYIVFLDPPKETTKPALKALKSHGIVVKILTGDSELVALNVCKDILLDAEEIITGNNIEKLTDEELIVLIKRSTLFARLSPMHKERIVSLLRKEGHVVGFMGDGINDAPALRAADIGISVENALDVAREAADIILLEKNLMVLENGVIEGRRTFSNMLKYIKMTASSNFGNVFSVLIASAFLPFLPMLPIHLLIQNMIYDISQIVIPFDNVDAEQIQKPKRWNQIDLGRFMLFFGLLSSIFDIITFCIMWFIFKANLPKYQTLFQSGWFEVSLLSQTLIVHMMRTRQIPFIQSVSAWPLIAMTGIVIIIGIILPYSPLAIHLQMQALPFSYFPWLVVILSVYMIMIQILKGIYSKRYGWE